MLVVVIVVIIIVVMVMVVVAVSSVGIVQYGGCRSSDGFCLIVVVIIGPVVAL